MTSLVTSLSTRLQETTPYFWVLEHVLDSTSGQTRCKCLAQYDLLYFSRKSSNASLNKAALSHSSFLSSASLQQPLSGEVFELRGWRLAPGTRFTSWGAGRCSGQGQSGRSLDRVGQDLPTYVYGKDMGLSEQIKSPKEKGGEGV